MRFDSPLRLAAFVCTGFLSFAACSGDDSSELSAGKSDSGTADSGGSVSTEPIGSSNAGDITYYDADGRGACSFDATPSDLDVAAMNAPQFAGSAVCGTCARITGPKGELTVRIVDLCPECKSGDLDLSKEAFGKLADESLGRVKVTWQPVRCNVAGPVSYKIKDGSSRYWTAIQVRNHTRPVAKLELRGSSGTWAEVRRESYNYFVADKGTGADGPFSVRITSDSGEVLEDTLPGPIAESVTSGKANFR